VAAVIDAQPFNKQNIVDIGGIVHNEDERPLLKLFKVPITNVFPYIDLV
jgi:hypothetical protein